MAGLAWVQDGGRPGRMHEGVPAGGALVPELLARANAAVGNPGGYAALEVFGAITLGARGAPILVASEDGVPRELVAGREWRLEGAGRRVRYAAVRGGIAVPEVLGGRGTLLVARLGGQEGRPLRKGDVLSVGGPPRQASGHGPPAPDPGAPIGVVPGPDSTRFLPGALETLIASEYRVSAGSDRVGVRLAGPALPRADEDDGVSEPMVRGAIQVPASGQPVVLGPDHPTMGGYPVIATVVSSSFGSLMMRAPGSVVRFARASRDS